MSMIEFLSKWAEGIVMAVVIAAIIEMILPHNQNKKYVKMIVGVYIVFTIVSPFVQQFSDVDFSNLQVENLLEAETTTTTADMDYTNNYITTLYIRNLQKDMQSKLEAKGYTAEKILVQIDEGSQDMPIQRIVLEGVRKQEQGVPVVNKVEIMAESVEEETVALSEQEELKAYFSETYAVLKANIEIS